MSIGIEAIGAGLTFGGTGVGVIVDFSLPEDRNKEFNVEGLGDSREVWKKSAMKVGQIFTYTVRHDTELIVVTADSVGEFIETMPIQTAGNAVPETNTFTGFVLSVGPLDGSLTDSEGLTRTYEVRLQTEIAHVAESLS